jgi:hypothetical protein
MTLDEEKDLIKGLATSPDFLSALSEALDQVVGKSVTVQEIGLWFFSQGYLSCLDYQDKRKMTRPFKYQPEGKDEQTK